MKKKSVKKLFTTLLFFLFVSAYCSGYTISGDKIVCQGSTVEYSVALSGTDSPQGWTVSSNGQIIGDDKSTTVTIKWISSGSGRLDFTYASNGTYYIVSKTDITIVGPTGAPYASASPLTICQGQTTTLSGGVTNATGAEFTYSWTGSNNFSSSNQSNTISPSVGTNTYYFTATDQCSNSYSYTVSNVVVNPNPSFNASSSAAGTVCPQTKVTLTATPSVPGTNYTYKWTPTATLTPSSGLGSQVVAAPSVTTPYYVTATNTTTGCTSTNFLTVNVYPRATVQVANSEILVCANPGTFSLTATGASSYVWSPNTGLNSTTQASVTGTVDLSLLPIIYTVIGRNNDGCNNTEGAAYVTVSGGLPKPETIYGYSDGINGPAGPAYICINPSDQSYYINSYNNSPSKTFYNWYFSDIGDASVVGTASGYGVTSVMAHFNTGFAGSKTLYVKATNACGTAIIGGITTEVDGAVPPTPTMSNTTPTTVCNGGKNTTLNLNYMAIAADYEFSPSAAIYSSSLNQYGAITVDWADNYVGTVSVRGRARNGCGYSAWSPYKYINITNGTACRLGDLDDDNVSSADGWSVSIFPNPSSRGASLHFINPFSESAQVEVSDATGNIVGNYKAVSTNIDFSIGEDFSNGIYFVKIVCGENQKILKLVKN